MLLLSCSVVSTLCDLMDCSMPRFSVLHHLPEFAQTPVHWVDIPSNPLSIQSVPLSIIHYQSDKTAYKPQLFFVLKNCIYEILFLSPFTPLLCIYTSNNIVNMLTGVRNHIPLYFFQFCLNLLINTFTFINKNFKVLFYIIILF